MFSIYVSRIGWTEEIWPAFMATYYSGKKVIMSWKLKKDWGITVAKHQPQYTVRVPEECFRIDFDSEKRYSLFCLAFSDLIEKHKVGIPSRLEAARERYKRNNEGC